MRNPHNQVNQPGNDGIHLFSKRGRRNAKQPGNHGADRRCADADDNTDGKTGHGPGQHIPPQPVGPKQVGKAGRQVFPGEIGNER